MPFTCTRCGAEFSKQRDLQLHEARKRPCNAVTDHQCVYCHKSYTRADSLTRHKKVCIEARTAEITAQLATFQARLDVIEQKGPIGGISVTNSTINNTINNTVTNVTITPWGSPLQLTDADVEAALANIPGIADTPALPEVVATLMELVKRAHIPVAARNNHLNPKRCDQALALTAGGWATIPLSEATSVLFDGASAWIAAAARPATLLVGSHLVRSIIPTQYRIDKEAAVQLGLRPMEAHLANVGPGGPGPILLIQDRTCESGDTHVQLKVQPTHTELVKTILKTHPLRCSESGAMLIDWIVAASQAAGLSGRELFKALETGAEDPALAVVWRAAQQFTEEKMRPRAAAP